MLHNDKQNRGGVLLQALSIVVFAAVITACASNSNSLSRVVDGAEGAGSASDGARVELPADTCATTLPGADIA